MSVFAKEEASDDVNVATISKVPETCPCGSAAPISNAPPMMRLHGVRSHAAHSPWAELTGSGSRDRGAQAPSRPDSARSVQPAERGDFPFALCHPEPPQLLSAQTGDGGDGAFPRMGLGSSAPVQADTSGRAPSSGQGPLQRIDKSNRTNPGFNVEGLTRPVGSTQRQEQLCLLL